MNQYKGPPELLARASSLAETLVEAIHSGDRERILSAQVALTEEARNDWTMVEERGDLSPKDKALARLVAGMALEELPRDIQDPANYPQVLSRMRLLKNSLVLL